MTFAALIVAAGRGVRAGKGLPKQYRPLHGVPVLRHALNALTTHRSVSHIQVVWNEDDAALYQAAVDGLPALMPPVAGGATRQHSVLNGLDALAALPEPPSHVLIHDAARPFLSQALISRAVAAMQWAGAAIPVLPVTDTIKRLAGDGLIAQTLDRSTLVTVQTPQVFHLETLLAAHRKAAAAGFDTATDDAAIMEWAGHDVATFLGESENIKMTHPEDFSRNAAARRPRIGQGYDVHAFGAGDHVMLGGVRIAHARGIDAHSDGDVLLHALTDALLGSISAGDIGQHFPPSDPQWRHAASHLFVRHAVKLVAERGGRIENVDLSLIAEEPRIGPHRAAIITCIAEMLGLPEDGVGLKATTNEKMGFLGRKEGLAAMAVALVTLP